MSTQIANLALRHLGNSNEIADILTERGQEARAARAFYDIARDETLRDCKLPSTRRYAALALVENNPAGEYLFSYRLPIDCVGVRGLVLPRIASSYAAGISTPLYKLTSDDSGGLILTNIEDVTIEYTARITNVDTFPADFKMALSFKLAFLMAPSITGGDPFKRGPICAQAYDLSVSKAKTNAYNEEPSSQAPPSELVSAHFGCYDDGGYPISGRTN